MDAASRCPFASLCPIAITSHLHVSTSIQIRKKSYLKAFVLLLFLYGLSVWTYIKIRTHYETRESPRQSHLEEIFLKMNKYGLWFTEKVKYFPNINE